MNPWLQAAASLPAQPQGQIRPAALEEANGFSLSPVLNDSRPALAWEGATGGDPRRAPALPARARAAAAGRPLHSEVPVQVAYHTSVEDPTNQHPREFTRQLDRQFSALSMVSAKQLLKGIKTYRKHGRDDMSGRSRRARRNYVRSLERSLQRQGLTRTQAKLQARAVGAQLALLHEADQVLSGTGQPSLRAVMEPVDPARPGLSPQRHPSLGYGPVNGSIGRQHQQVVPILEKAIRSIPRRERSRVRLNMRVVLTSDVELAQALNRGEAVLVPRTFAEVTRMTPRDPTWTTAWVARVVAAGYDPWNPPPGGWPPALRSGSPVLGGTGARPGPGASASVPAAVQADKPSQTPVSQSGTQAWLAAAAALQQPASGRLPGDREPRAAVSRPGDGVTAGEPADLGTDRLARERPLQGDDARAGRGSGRPADLPERGCGQHGSAPLSGSRVVDDLQARLERILARIPGSETGRSQDPAPRTQGAAAVERTGPDGLRDQRTDPGSIQDGDGSPTAGASRDLRGPDGKPLQGRQLALAYLAQARREVEAKQARRQVAPAKARKRNRGGPAGSAPGYRLG